MLFRWFLLPHLGAVFPKDIAPICHVDENLESAEVNGLLRQTEPSINTIQTAFNFALLSGR